MMPSTPQLKAVAASVSLLSLALFSLPARAAEPTNPPQKSPLAFLEPFLGVWLPHPDWEPLEKDPKLRSLVPLNLQWNEDRTSAKIEEGLRHGSEYTTSGIVVWNPVSEQAEFLAQQIDGNLIFDGYYEPVDADTIRRVYDVIDESGGVRVFRETFHIGPDGVLDWTTEKQVDGVFEPVSGRPGPEFHAIRPDAKPSNDLEDFAALIGEWRPDLARIPAQMSEWRKRNRVSDGYVSFSWGTANRWIVFGEHRKQEETWRQEGSGLLAWDPRSRRVVYREHTDSGVTLEGVLERVDPLTIQRHYRSAHPDGSVRQWQDTWRWEKGEDPCFEWTTTSIEGKIRDVRQPYWVCRRSEASVRQAIGESAVAPSWATQHLQALIGSWIADNAEHKTPQEPFDAYKLVWEWAAGGKSVTGRLVAIQDHKDLGTLWEYRVVWHPSARALRVYQFGTDGSMSEGDLESTGENSTQLTQTLFTADGDSAKIGHRDNVEGKERVVQSFSVSDDGAWLPLRTYIFRREE